jgi:hypothetical protein
VPRSARHVVRRTSGQDTGERRGQSGRVPEIAASPRCSQLPVDLDDLDSITAPGG